MPQLKDFPQFMGAVRIFAELEGGAAAPRAQSGEAGLPGTGGEWRSGFCFVHVFLVHSEWMWRLQPSHNLLLFFGIDLMALCSREVVQLHLSRIENRRGEKAPLAQLLSFVTRPRLYPSPYPYVPPSPASTRYLTLQP
jgi:hypothetical protein